MENIQLDDLTISDFDNNVLNHYKSVNPPRESFLFFPSRKEVFFCSESENVNKLIRKIFNGSTEYLEFENEHLKNLKTELKKSYPNNEFSWDDGLILKYLIASRNDYKKAIQLIIEYFHWRKKIFPIILTDSIKKILNSGFIYGHGRDNRFRPIIVLNPEIYMKDRKMYSYNDWMTALIYFFEFLIENCLIPGQIENWNLICSLDNLNILFLPKELKNMLNTLTQNFCCRLNRMFIINVSFFQQALWIAIKNLLDPITQNKIKLFRGLDQIKLLKFINKEQIEKKFGGQAENIEKNFFPPKFPSNAYLLSKERYEEILVSESKYIEMVNSNNKIVVSPYLEEMTKNKNKMDQDSIIIFN